MQRTQATFFVAGIAAIFLWIFGAYSGAVIVNPGATGNCNYLNSTFIACKDGVPINISFLVNAPYPQSYGTFAVSTVDTANVTEALDSFGNPCTVPSGSSNACFVTLKAIPISMGNGTIPKSIKLRLRSIPYPQLVFNNSINITIYHYLDHNGTLFENEYTATLAQYQYENSSYRYFCIAYSICNSGLGYGIQLAGSYLQFAAINANKGTIKQALYNISAANSTMGSGYSSFLIFVNTSNRIINNQVQAQYIIANSINQFNAYRAKLTNCSVGNTNYAARIGRGLNNSLAYPRQTVLNGSQIYLGYVNNVSAYEANAIGYCANGKAAPPSGNQSSGFLQKYWVDIVVGVVIIIIALYALMRFRSAQEIKRIREGAEEKKHEEEEREKADEERRHGDQPEQEAGSEPEGKEVFDSKDGKV